MATGRPEANAIAMKNPLEMAKNQWSRTPNWSSQPSATTIAAATAIAAHTFNRRTAPMSHSMAINPRSRLP